GVDIDEIKRGHSIILTLIKRSQAGRVVYGRGHYAGLVDIGEEKALAIHTDGVGTKVLIAQLMDKYDTIGIDCVAMNVNDVICVGAEPIAFVDYIALKKMDSGLIKDLTKGLVRGAKESGVAIVGGETAVMPDVIQGVSEKAFDLAGTVVGLVRKDRIIDGSALRVGDIVIGVESNGIHSNGLSLARKVLLPRYGLKERPKGLKRTLGEELLRPTRIYVRPVLEILQKGIEITGLAHITGGAFTKLRRIGDVAGIGFDLSDIPEPPPIFGLIQREGRVPDKEMYRTFNMGVGFCVCAPSHSADEVEAVFRKYGMNTYRMGRLVSKRGVTVKGLRLT
ncbi:MAG: phosphoribosylformylglycinamidine cyclo-ligase, partial [Nitrososphaerota archaeon]